MSPVASEAYLLTVRATTDNIVGKNAAEIFAGNNSTEPSKIRLPNLLDSLMVVASELEGARHAGAKMPFGRI